MKAFITISLYLLSVFSLFSYNKIEFVKDIDDYRIFGPLDNSGMSMLNDSIAVLYHCTVDDTAMVLKDWSPIAIANYNINTESVEFYYDRQSSTMQNWFYDPAFLTKDKSKVFAFGSFDHINIKFGDVWSDFYYDSVEVFNTSNGHIDSVFRIDGYKFANCSNMYNGNIAFMAIKENDSLYYKYETYVGELNPDTYSYTLTKTPDAFEKDNYPKIVKQVKIVKSYQPGVEKEAWLQASYWLKSTHGEIISRTETYSFILDDSLRYCDEFMERNIWKRGITEFPGTLNHDSIYVAQGRLVKAYELIEDTPWGFPDWAGYASVPSLTIGSDEKNKYFISEGWIKDSLPVVYFYYKIYDYQNGVTIDSVFTDNPLEHPLFQYVGGTNFNISNDSIGIVIFKGSIWKFRLFSSNNGIDSNENERELIKSIYPNPTLSTLNVEFNKELSYNDINKIKIIDVTGKSLNTNITYENSNIISINMENFSPGSYILIYNGEVRKFEVVK